MMQQSTNGSRLCPLWLRVEAAVLLMIAKITLRRVSFARIREYLERPVASPEREPDVALVAEAVNRASARAADATCLGRCLATALMLRRRGASPVLHFGVRANESRPDFHAWLTYRGMVLLNDHDAQSFKPLYSIVPRQ